MQCLKCQHDIPEDAVFCNECGNKFIAACPECDKENTPISKFFNKCGYYFKQPSEPVCKELSADENRKDAKICNP